MKGEEEINRFFFQVIEDQEVQNHFTQKGIQMKHIPPKSLHWGGMNKGLADCTANMKTRKKLYSTVDPRINLLSSPTTLPFLYCTIQ